MSSIIKTRTQGFRVSTFRNQEVHKYYNHLQSVMRSIDSNGTYSDLFAKPEIDAMAVGETEIEWTCSSSSKAVHLSQLSDAERNRVEKIVSDAYSRIDAYIAENRTKSGKNRDYAQFLSIVGKRPDPNQIWVVNGKPVIVQWGFVDENGLMGSSGIYSDWDSFIKDIRKSEPEKPKEEPVKVVEEPAKTENLNEAVVAAPAAASSLFADQEKVIEKAAEPAPQPKSEEPQPKPVEKKEEPKPAPKKVDTEKKKTVYAGLGGYEWVKWVAILLAIIILLLLLLRLLFPPRFPNDLFGQNGTNIGAINGGGMGGSGGGMGGSDGGGMGGGNGSGGQGGDNGSGGQNGGGNPAINPNEPCPVCSKPFGNHGPEDYKKCIRQASKSGQGNGGAAGSPSGAGQGAGGDGQGSPSGVGSQGDANGAGGAGQGSPSGAGSQGGANGAGGAGQGSPSGAGSQGGANGAGGAGQGSPSGANGQGGDNGAGGAGQGSPSGAGSQGGANGIGGDDQGSLSGAGSQGGANGTGGDDQGSLSGAGSQGGANGAGGAGQGSPSGANGQGGDNGAGGAGQGSPSGADGQGGANGASGDDQGSLSGAGSQGGANGTGGQGDSDENAVESSKQQKDDDKGFNPEDICPVCNRQFLLHDEEDLKNCILASQRDKIEVQKKFEKLKSATTNYNKAVKELNSGN